MMRVWRMIPPSLAIALAFALASPARAEVEPPPMKGNGQWLEVLFHGGKAGFMYGEDEVTTLNGRPAVHLKRWSLISVRRTDQEIRIELTTDSWSEPNGRPLRYKHVRVEGRDARTSEGWAEGDTFVVKHAIGGNVAERKVPITPDLRLATFLEVTARKNLKKGAAWSGQALLEEEGDVQPYSMKVTGTEKGSSGPVFVVETQIAGVQSVERMRADGRTVDIEMKALGVKLVASTREKAMTQDGTVDVFSAAMFSVPEPLPLGSTLQSLTLRLRGKSGKAPEISKEDRARARPAGRDAIVVKLETPLEPLKAPRLPVAAPTGEGYLAETPYETLGDPKLKAAALGVVGGETDAWLAAKRLNAFVHQHIKKKSLARAFATASEAYATQEGDCTEHAVLFSALAKIVGIPTRLLTGLVYVGGPSRQFGYHEWVEVWMGDRWVAMDPTFGEDLANPTHVAFTRGLSDPEGLRRAGLAAASLIGEVELAVVEYTTTSGQKKKF